MNSWIDLNALWKTVVYGLVVGAGLPALFSVGLLALSRGPRARTAGASGDVDAGDSDVVYGGNILGAIVAVIIVLIILAAIGWAIHYIYVAGHTTTAKPKVK
jgi:hypothetical protein